MAHRIERLNDKAEGYCGGIPYNTELASINGVSIHFWMGERADDAELLARIEAIARRNRDVVRVTYSDGEPDGFWARQDMRET